MNKNNLKKFGSILLVTSLLLVACNDKEVEKKEKEVIKVGTKNVILPGKVNYSKEELTDSYEEDKSVIISLSNEKTKIKGSGASLKDSTITISKSGTYVFSGNLDNGQVVVDVGDKETVRIVLNNAIISSSTSAAIHIKNSDKTIITLEKDSNNTLSDAKKYKDTSNNAPTGTIFSSDDLVFNGSGILNVNGNFNNAIVSRDDLKIANGNFIIYSVDDGIIGKDMLSVLDGIFDINVKGDGISSTNDKDADKGFIVINGGKFKITSGNDSIQAETSIVLNDGNFNILSGGGSSILATKEEKILESAKGLKANNYIVINNGTFNINSLDDAIHSNNSVEINNGEIIISTDDDAIHANKILTINNGNIDIKNCYEGLEAIDITINKGKITIIAIDDGLNANLDNISSISINGGDLFINASGDGIDSNNNIEMTGGNVVLYGSKRQNDGAIDYDGTFIISGGTIIASGTIGMVQSTSDKSNQNSILMFFSDTINKKSKVTLKDDKNNLILEITPIKEFETILFSSKEIKKGNRYTININDGKVVTFEVIDTSTWVNEKGIAEPIKETNPNEKNLKPSSGNKENIKPDERREHFNPKDRIQDKNSEN